MWSVTALFIFHIVVYASHVPVRDHFFLCGFPCFLAIVQASWGGFIQPKRNRENQNWCLLRPPSPLGLCTPRLSLWTLSSWAETKVLLPFYYKVQGKNTHPSWGTRPGPRVRQFLLIKGNTCYLRFCWRLLAGHWATSQILSVLPRQFQSTDYSQNKECHFIRWKT
jgi:hypothetical protein